MGGSCQKMTTPRLLSFWPLAELALLCVLLFLSFDFYYSWGEPYSFAIPPEQHLNIFLALPLYVLAHLLIFYNWKAKRLRSLFLRREQEGQTELTLWLRSLGSFFIFTVILSLISIYAGEAFNPRVALVFLCILSIVSFYKGIYKYLSLLWRFEPSSALHIQAKQKKYPKYLSFAVLLVIVLLFPFALNLSRELKAKVYPQCP